MRKLRIWLIRRPRAIEPTEAQSSTLLQPLVYHAFICSPLLVWTVAVRTKAKAILLLEKNNKRRVIPSLRGKRRKRWRCYRANIFFFFCRIIYLHWEPFSPSYEPVNAQMTGTFDGPWRSYFLVIRSVTVHDGSLKMTVLEYLHDHRHITLNWPLHDGPRNRHVTVSSL